MKTGLPAEIDPIQLSEEGTRLTGELSGTSMSRLREDCTAISGPVRIDLRFDKTTGGQRLMSGTIELLCQTLCQRCMRSMDLSLEAKTLTLLLTPEEQVAAGDSDVRESIIAKGRVSLSSLVEDELLLAMPMIPMHDSSECSVTGCTSGSNLRDDATTNKQSPFAVLGALKNKDEN